ncbi:MAG: hypothetical protein H7Z38_13105 [Rubrivivax sp.]|nr:hypothetical protein [Pyrinomonadaceae bacterium]
MIRRLLLAAVAVVAATSLSPALAQGPPPGGPDKNMKGEMDGVRERSGEIERVKRDAEKPDKKSEKPPDDKFPQIKEDFERIQIINSDVLQAVGTPDYGRLSEAAEEVRKRAARLKSNLFAPESEKKSKGEVGEARDQPELKSLLSALDDALARFVGSPIFQNTKVVNPQDSAKARLDLDEVIKLSTRVVKEVDKMKKPGGG